jgi:hypothetical protein
VVSGEVSCPHSWEIRTDYYYVWLKYETCNFLIVSNAPLRKFRVTPRSRGRSALYFWTHRRQQPSQLRCVCCIRIRTIKNYQHPPAANVATTMSMMHTIQDALDDVRPSLFFPEVQADQRLTPDQFTQLIVGASVSCARRFRATTCTGVCAKRRG